MKQNNIVFIKLIYEAFNKNIEAHELSEASQKAYWLGDYDLAGDYSSEKRFLYNKKSKILIKAIKLLKKNKLKFKYGVNDGILYVIIDNIQISFHIFNSYFKNIKKYNGKWSNRPHKFNPLSKMVTGLNLI